VRDDRNERWVKSGGQDDNTVDERINRGLDQGQEGIAPHGNITITG
jgi:hypothetical protein